jgi:peptidyl-prolyl cis-trans isomerase D
VHFGDFGGGRDLAGADRPDRLISDSEIIASLFLRQRGIDLCGNHGNRSTRLADLEAFADAENDGQAVAQRRRGLGADVGVGFAVGFAPLAVADDGQGRAGVFQHAGAEFAGMRALVGHMDVLATDRETGRCLDRPLDERCRQAQGDVAAGGLGAKGNGRDLAKLGAGAVHLPVSGNQLAARHDSPSLACRHFLPPLKRPPTFSKRETRMAAFFRRLSKSTIGTAFMVFVLLAILAGFALQDIRGVGSGGMGLDPGTLARVGDERVTERELSAAMQRRLTEIRQQNPEADYSALSGDFSRILNSLIQNRALQAFARKHDVYVSKRLVDAEIVKIPGTRGLDGKFSDQAYQTFLQQRRLTDAEVRDLLSSGLVSRLLLAPAAANARMPVGVATPYASMLLEAREAEVAVIPAKLFAAGIPQPTEADIQAFYKQNSTRYMVPEQRVLNIARIGPEQVAKVVATDQEIAAYYIANQALYGGKAIRELSQVIVQSEADGRALAQRARAGAGLGPNATSLGAKSRQEMADIAGDAVAAAAFAARQSDIVGPIRSDLGWHVIQVDRISNQAGKPLSAVRAEIAAKVTADKRKEALTDLVTKIEDSIADGASFAEAVKSAGIPAVRTPAITAGGVARSQPAYNLPPELAPVVRSGFELGEGDEPVVETLAGDAGYALVGVEDIVAAAPAPLASIRDQVLADWKAKQARDRAKAAASEIAAKVARGADMAAAMAGAGVNMPPPEKVAKRRLELSAFQGKVPPALGMMFSLAQGRSRMIADPQGRGFIIVKVTKIIPGNANLQPGLISRMQSEFQQAAAGEYTEQMAKAIEADVAVKRNESAIAASRKRIVGGGG